MRRSASRSAFDYGVAESVEHTIEPLGEHGEDAKLLAGGHPPIPLMRLTGVPVSTPIPSVSPTSRMPFGGRASLMVPDRARPATEVAEADLVIGAVAVVGTKAPKQVTREVVASMREGSVVVDVASDQGGRMQTGRPTTRQEPTYVEEGLSRRVEATLGGTND